MQTILGAGGAIGKELAKELSRYSARIRLFARHPQKINDADELLSGNLLDEASVNKAVEGSEIVYLVAGLSYNIKTWRAEWPRIMELAINACEKYKSRLVFFDNIYMYHPSGLAHMTEETLVGPVSEKGKVRKQIADMLMEEVRSGRVEAMIVRAADFYGPGVQTSVIMETVYKNYLKGKKANWLGNPDKIHNYTYVPDAAKATALLGNTPEAYGQVWHLPTSSEKFTGKDWIQMFAKEMKVKPSFMAVPKIMVRMMGLFMPVMREMPEMMYQNDRDYFFSSEKFEKKFPGFSITPNAEGVKATVAAG